MQTKTAIQALINSDPTMTSEERKALDAALNLKPLKAKVIPISPKETAAMIGCHVATLRRWEKQGVLIPTRLSSRKIRYDRNIVELFIAEGRQSLEVSNEK